MLAGGLFVAAAVFAAVLPFLIDAEAVRENLARSLSAWSGGPVVITGPLRIASFADLSVEASGVKLLATPGLEPISRAEARTVTAVARLSSLLRGKLEFKKFVVASPRFVFRRGFAKPHPSAYGLETAGTALALSAKSPFSDIEFLEPVFFIAESGRKPFRRTELERIRVGRTLAGPLARRPSSQRFRIGRRSFQSVRAKERLRGAFSGRMQQRLRYVVRRASHQRILRQLHRKSNAGVHGALGTSHGCIRLRRFELVQGARRARERCDLIRGP